MNVIKELRKTTKMSQSKFAAYLEIPVANIQHWEQGVTTPPDYLVSLIMRVMKYDGYIRSVLTAREIDIIRQTQATLSLEQLYLDEDDKNDLMKLVRGEMSREEYQNLLRGQYQSNAE